ADNIAETTGLLAAARVELERIGNAWRAAMSSTDTEPSFERFLGQIQFDEEMRRLADIAKGQGLSEEIRVFVQNLEAGEKLTASMRTEVEQQVEAWQDAKNLFDAGIISSETLTRVQDSLLQPIEVTAKRMKELKQETDKFAVS